MSPEDNTSEWMHLLTQQSLQALECHPLLMRYLLITLFITGQGNYIHSSETYAKAGMSPITQTSSNDTEYGLPSLTNASFPNHIRQVNGEEYIGNLTNSGLSSSINQRLSNVTNQGSYIGNEFLDEIVVYSAMIISVFGMSGNLLCLLIMLRPPVKEMAHSLMCAALALVDLIFMVFHFTVSLASIITGKHIVNLLWLNRPLCKFVIFFQFCLHLDANIIVGLSIQRVICVFKPLQAAKIITKSRIKLYLAVISIFFFLFNGESAIRYDWYEISSGYVICEPMYFYGLPKQFWVMKDLISTLFMSFIPLIIISVCNIALLIKLALRKQMQSQLGVNTNESEYARTNRTVIMIMSAFIVLVSPAPIYNITVSQNNINDPILRVLAIGTILNPSINFLLYFLASSMYRKALRNLFAFK